MAWSFSLPKSPIGKRVILYTVLVSSLITLVITCVQLYRDYHADIEQIDGRFKLIQQIHLSTIADALWTLDERELKIHLDGIIQMRDVVYLEVNDGSKKIATAGKIIGEQVIEKRYKIQYYHLNQDRVIGELVVVASLDNVFNRMINKVAVILVSNAVKTFLVAGFILFFFHANVTRYITQLADYVAKIRPDNLKQEHPIFIDKKPRRQEDELDKLAYGIKRMQGQLNQAFEALKNHKANLEVAVDDRTQELQRMNSELESFSYSVSHDLRAPLRAIEGFSRLLEDEGMQVLSEEGKHFLTRIRTNVYKMAELIDDLLTLSRVGQKQLELKQFNLNTLCSKVLHSVSAHYPEKHVELKVRGAMPILADEALLEIVITNLFDNAVKYSGDRDPVIIEVDDEEQDGKAVYHVSDNGVGFDSQYADKLFVPFQRLHPDKSIPGNGVGLATVYRIIERHGGRIEGSSTLGQGATFTFYLKVPAQKIDEELDGASAHPLDDRQASSL